MSSPQRGFAPATIAYKAIILTAITMGAVDKAGEVCPYVSQVSLVPILLLLSLPYPNEGDQVPDLSSRP